jgi:hypothetical protein
MAAQRTADRILHLDFDGVLHDEDVYWHPRKGIYMATLGCVLFEWMPVLEELWVPHPEVAIVLSTSWVRIRSFSLARDCLSASLAARVIGATFHSRDMRRDEFAHLPRGVHDVFRRRPKQWLAIDDDSECWPDWCRNRLVAAEGDKELGGPATQRVVRAVLERH